MKWINRLFILALGLSVFACELTELDYQQDPNNAAPEQANIDALYNNLQLELASIVEGTWFPAAGMSRMVAATGSFQYQDAFTPQGFNGIWNNAYADFMPDVRALLDISNETVGFEFYAGTAKIMEAYALMVLVDMFGNVPYSEAFQGLDNPGPTADDGAAVYSNAIDLLDQGIADLQAAGSARPATDIFYGGSAANWITLANTLKLRAAVTTRLVDPAASTATIQSLIGANADIIDETSEDFQFQYGANRQNPDSRHPLYANMYENADGSYMSNYFMWLLRADKQSAQGSAVVDPRIRFYFYRKTDDAVGAEVNEYSCHLSNTPTEIAPPAWYQAVDPDLPYCVASADGYWGRDHLNNQGIPPDGPLRTAYGLYPMGGKFDDDSFEDTQNLGTDGARGAGIQPIMLASFVDFLRAEAALTLNTGDDAEALLLSGMEKSIAKVISFKDKVPQQMNEIRDVRGDLISVEQLFVPKDTGAIKNYIDFVMDEYQNAGSDDERLNIIVREHYIALWGNGLEAYNLYRRTGKPDNMAPAIENNPGPFARSHWYPADHVNLNANASQKSVTDQVFWDDGKELY